MEPVRAHRPTPLIPPFSTNPVLPPPFVDVKQCLPSEDAPVQETQSRARTMDRTTAQERLRTVAPTFTDLPPSSNTDGKDAVEQTSGVDQTQEKQDARGVTAEQLKRIAPGITTDKAEEYAPLINQAMDEFGIDTPLRQSHFLSQIAHETDGFRTLREYASGKEYNGRSDLGNRKGTQDGVTYKGRGAIQLTGRYNYEKAGNDLGEDLLNNPKRAEDPDLAFRLAGWYWNTHNLNPKADRDDVKSVTKAINGGTNGLQSRRQYLKQAKEELMD